MLGTRKRMAPEVYWQIRCAATSCRDWVTLYFPKKNSDTWGEIWSVAESADLTLQLAYEQAERFQQGLGYPAVCQLLAGDDRLESWMSRMAAEIEFLQTGELAVKEDMMSSRPPGKGHLAPAWAVTNSRDAAKAQAMQRARVRGTGGLADPDDDEGVAGGSRRPRRRGRGGSRTPTADDKPRPKSGSKGSGEGGAQR